MPQCAVATCRNSHRRTRGRRIRYHRFPQIAEVRTRWVRACGRPPLANGDIPFNIQTARICSLHFTNDSYEKDMEHLVLGLPVRSRLRRGAVPTIGVPVNVQPVSKMLVEDAKRSILKVAHAKIVSGERKLMDIANEEKRFYQKCEDKEMDDRYQYKSTFRNKDDQKMGGIDVLLALGLKPAFRLNKMHPMDSATTTLGNDNGKKSSDSSKDSSKISPSRQNGKTFPAETVSPTEQSSTDRKITSGIVKKENSTTDGEDELLDFKRKKRNCNDSRKRQAAEDMANESTKKICFEQRERFIDSLIGCDRIATAEELEFRADELAAEVKALDELARAKEMEWNEILSMRKLKEEAYLRLARRRQVTGFLESNNGQHSDSLPAASLTLVSEWEDNQHNNPSFYQECQGIQETTEITQVERVISKYHLETGDSLRKETAEKQLSGGTLNSSDKHSKNITGLSKENFSNSEDISKRYSKMRSAIIESTSETRTIESPPPSTTRTVSSSQLSPSTSSLSTSATTTLGLNIDGRPISDGRQGPIVDVHSIIADHRLQNPGKVSRRGKKMRNSVNVGLSAGGAMVETSHGDSRPSSTDSCKSNPMNFEAVSFKDVLVQFAKLSQQQGEPVKTPQNYPDVTLHPVTPSQISINPAVNSGQSGSLLHGILTKTQSPRPTAFSPTLARLLTAPERDRGNHNCSNNGGGVGSHGGQVQISQNLLQVYQGSNPVSITDLLSSSKSRTEITITPVNSTIQPTLHSSNILHVEDIDEENSLADNKDSKRSCSNTRDHREDRDAPPRCQGCHERTAQFVCAGCGNQWYCSRECQVSAWDEHSEVCSG